MTENSTPPVTDDICTDPQIAYLKQKQMQKFRRHSFLSSIADSCKFVVGPLIAVGMSTLIIGSVAPAVSISLLAAAATFLITGVATSYAAARIWHDGQFNNYEISAKSTAHHMVQEIKANNMCFVKEAGRADGKSWCETVAAKKAAEQAQSL